MLKIEKNIRVPVAESRGMNIIRANDGSILIFAGLFDSSNNPIISGTTNLRIWRIVPSTGALEAFDFNDNTFKSGAVVTQFTTMTHQQVTDPGPTTINTGVWTIRLTGAIQAAFNVGEKYIFQIEHTNLPRDLQLVQQYGGAEGDQDSALETGIAQSATSTTLRLRAGASSQDDIFQYAKVVIDDGLGAGQERIAYDYDGTNKDLTVSPSWDITPDNTSKYRVMPAAAPVTWIRQSTADGLVDDIWDENIVTAHGTFQSAGLLLRILGADIATRSFNNTLNDLMGVPDTAASDTVTGQVWEELRASHNNAGTMGETMNTLAGGFPTVTDIENAVWDANLDTGHGGASTAGFFVRILASAIAARTNNANLNALLGVPDVATADVPYATWEENVGTIHGSANTAGLLVRVLGLAISQRTNTPSLNGLLGVADTAAYTIAHTILDDVIDASNHAIANSLGQRVRAIDLLTESGGVGDLEAVLNQTRKLDLDPLSGTPDADSVAGKLDAISTTLAATDRDIVVSLNLQGSSTLRIETAVEQYGVVQTSPWVQASCQIFDELGGLLVNLGPGDFDPINTRGFFGVSVSPHTLVAGKTYQVFVQITDGATQSISTTKPFKIIQG